MVRAADALDLSAREIAAMVQRGEVSALGVAAACFARIEERNPLVTAFLSLRKQQALMDAARLDQLRPDLRARLPLAGVPVAIKDEIAVAGLVTGYGGRGNSEPAEADAEVVARLRDAGAVVVGTTTQPEFGQVPFTEGAWGETVNPWNAHYSPAGSSGGAGVAVATGMVPVAIGSDGGGSVRLPAAVGGIFGLKPTRGRVSAAPYPDLWGELGTYGPLTRTVGDAATVLDVVSGSTPTDRWQLEVPEEGFASALEEEPAGIRIGWSIRPPVPGYAATREVAVAVARAAALLQRLGLHVEKASPRFPKLPWAFISQNWAGIAAAVERVQHPERLERRSRQTARLARLAGRGGLERGLAQARTITDTLEESLRGVDVLLMPVLPDVAPKRITTSSMGVLRSQFTSTRTVAYTAMFNVTGQPAASVPMGFTASGLPLAVQVVGRFGEERSVLAVAALLERANPWAQTLPVWPPRPAAS